LYPSFGRIGGQSTPLKISNFLDHLVIDIDKEWRIGFQNILSMPMEILLSKRGGG
jgi:hypothetical protein